MRRVINTTVGRVIFNDSIPAGLPFINGTLKKKACSRSSTIRTSVSATR